MRDLRCRILGALLAVFALAIWMPPSFVARAQQAAEDPVLEGFADLERYVMSLPEDRLDQQQKDLLLEVLRRAKAAYETADSCAVVRVFGEYFTQTQELRRGRNVSLAEDLHNRGRMLKNDAIGELDVPCGEVARGGRRPRIRVLESDNRHLHATLAFPEPLMWTVERGGELFTEIQVPGILTGLGEPGFPGVPTFRRLIAVPRGARVAVEVGETRVAEKVFLNLYPFQLPAADQQRERDPTFFDPPFTKNQAAYSRNAPYPDRVCNVVSGGRARDLEIAQLACAAGQYNPVTDEFVRFESLDLEVTFSGGSGKFITSRSRNPFDVGTQVVTRSVLNSSVIYKYVDVVIQKLPCFGEELLILTHPDFRSAAEDLAEWKRDKGISTSVFEVNDGAGSGPDTSEEIDDFIEERYNECTVRPSYVLLLGDAEYIPTFYTSTAYSSTTGSDFTYGVVTGGSFLSIEVGVGRIPVDTATEAQTVVDKTIGYERDPPAKDSFYETISMASYFQCCRDSSTDGTDMRAFIETSEGIRDELRADGYSVRRIYTTDTDFADYDGDGTIDYTGDATPNRYYNGTLLPSDLRDGSGFAWDGDSGDVVDAFNAGRFLIFHRDHGSKSGWSDPSLSTTNVQNDLTNGELLPVVFSVNCASGLFDNETNGGDYSSSTSSVYFVERLLRETDGGAVGMLGDTRNSNTWANNALAEGFFDAVWPDTVSGYGSSSSDKRLADILNYGKFYMLTQIGVDNTTEPVSASYASDQLYLWHVFGDPTLEMWTEEPLRLADKFATVTILKDALRVRYSVNRATITALQKSPEGIIPVGRARVRDGVATLRFVAEPDPDRPIRLSASLPNAVSLRLRTRGD